MSTAVLPLLEGTTLSGVTLQFPADLPAGGQILVIGFTHGARHDVAAWKAALAGRNLAFLSLPTAAVDTVPEAMASVAGAMRAHVPEGVWDAVLQVHRGGSDLRRTFGWLADDCAKVLQVSGSGAVLARHDTGPFSEQALAAFLAAGQGVGPLHQ